MRKSLVKVVVPLYKSRLDEDEKVALIHNFSVLRNYPHVLVAPEGLPLDDVPQQIEATVLRVSGEWLGRENGIAGYNKMCLSKEFYDMFNDCEYILICQTDSWVFRDELSRWCTHGYDYIGGIWWRKGIWSLPGINRLFPKNRQLYGKVGNGGFSLRRVERFREACVRLQDRIEFYLSQTHHMYSEDVFWAIEPYWFVYPSMMVATEFAFDNHPDRCMKLLGEDRLPFGCHGWSKRSRRQFWKRFIPMTEKRYLFYVTDYYAYPILFPLESEILGRGGRVAWFVEDKCSKEPVQSREVLESAKAVKEFNPIVVFAPGNYIPDFFPGIKVCLFHGYPINKRADKRDDHFSVRGWFDIYCTQGPSSTEPFRRIAAKNGTFKVYETGWPKADVYFSDRMLNRELHKRPVILYSSTFTRSLTSTVLLADTIEKAVSDDKWDWIFMFHPKLKDENILARYADIAARYPNAKFLGNTFSEEAMRCADVMLCDASSIMLEFMFMDKPVVSFRNTAPGPFLMNVVNKEDVVPAIEKALSRPACLMDKIHEYTLYHEPHRDCKCSSRVVDAIDKFEEEGGRAMLKRKPLNIVRKMKLRYKLHYPIFKDLFS